VIAGLDRAVDPNGDGDTHDAVRVALLGVAEPYAAFTDGPEAQAVQGALNLNTLVVAPAGNDGKAGPMFGSIAGPAGAPGSLAVGATDSRAQLPRVRVVLRRGLDVISTEAATARRDRTVALAEPRAATPRSTRGLAGSQSVDYFSPKGYSLVAGRAVVVPWATTRKARRSLPLGPALQPSCSTARAAARRTTRRRGRDRARCRRPDCCGGRTARCAARGHRRRDRDRPKACGHEQRPR
jgi:hypothetical protein